MSKQSATYRRQRERETLALLAAGDEAKAKQRQSTLEKLPGYQALLQDPEWHVLEKEYREILAHFKAELAWVGQRARDELTLEEQARVDAIHLDRQKALGAWRARAMILQRDYGLDGAIVEQTEPKDTKAPASIEDHSRLSAAEVASKYGIPFPALESRLRRYRAKNPGGGGWNECENAKSREPRFLYSVRAIWPIIQDLKRRTNAE